jgi:hypothetical protein
MRKAWLVGCVLSLTVLSGESVRAEGNAEMKALLDKAIKAHGGVEALQKHKAVTENIKGKFSLGGMEANFNGTWFVQFPDQIKAEMNVEIGNQQTLVTNVFNKDKGWVNVAGNTIDMTDEMAKAARDEMHSGWVITTLYPLRDEKLYKLSPLGESEINKEKVVGMLVERKGYPEVNLYFNKESGLLQKAEFRVVDFSAGNQEVTQEMFFSDHKTVHGVMAPHQFKIKRDGKDFLEGEVSNVQVFEKLPANTFEKP